jgi:hypothetical protein
VKNPKHSDMFPRSLPGRLDIRGQRLPFQEYYCKTDRLFDSTIPAIARLLNENHKVIRRMRNTSELLPMAVRNGIVKDYGQKLLNSGYSLDQARKICMAGLKGYESDLKESRRPGGRKLHRSAAESSGSRYRKKLTGKSEWFRTPRTTEDNDREDSSNHFSGVEGCVGSIEGRPSTSPTPPPKTDPKTKTGKEDIRTTSVLFVEQTRKGELAANLSQVEQRLQE